MTIIVPVESKLSNIDIQVMSGDISLKAINTEQLTTLTYSGDNSFIDMVIGMGDLQTISGDIEVKDLQSSRVKIVTTSGDITVKGKVYGNSTFDVTSGDIEIECDDQEKRYSYNLSTTSGGISVDGKEIEDENGASKNVQNSKENSIKAASISGDIQITFGK